MANIVFGEVQTSIFESMSRLAIQHDAINLGQGFPVGLDSAEVLAEAQRALRDLSQQYPPSLGLPDLRQAVAEANRRFWGIEVDWQTEVLVTSGATEALSDCFFGLFNPGDEVILFEPAYDSYGPILRRAGVVPVRMRLQPPHWTLPCQSIEAAITPRTRAILINSPMNPIGKVFDREELSFLAGLLERYDLLAICDEVYEHLTFNEDGHIPLMSLPQARNRSLRIGSAGKTFSVTGWKVGYVTGPANLLGPVSRAHQYLTFATPPHLQAAVAYGLRLPDDYFIGLQNELRRRRDLLTDRLRDGGFEVGDCQGTYFLCLGIDNLGRGDDDVDLCRRLVTEAGVAAIPVSAFYGDRDVRTQIRLCFAKPQPLLEEAAERLVAWRKKG